MTIGNKIAHCRKQRGMTQDALAQLLGVTNQAVSKWESDQSCPDVMLLPRIADIFEISLDELFDREPKREPVKISCHELPWRNDDTLHVVLYRGHTLLRNSPAAKEITFIYEGPAWDIDSAFSVQCGDVDGDVNAGADVNCGNVGGDVSAGAGICCGSVSGDVNAGSSVSCGNVDGDVNAGAYVSCGNICGDVDAGTDVNCGNVSGDVDAGLNVKCGDVEGDVDAGCAVECGNVGGDIDACGTVTIRK